MSIDFGLKDVHVLITGASGGIGLETVHTFLQLGARVTAHYNSAIGPLATLPNIIPIQADVRSETDVQNLLDSAAQQNNGPVSVLVVNHGVWPPNEAPIADMELAQWTDTLAVNLMGPFLLCRAYLRALRSAPEACRATANIVFIGSTAGKFGEAGHGDYASSKAALMYGLTRTLKNEIVSVAPRGRVNCVSPGWVATPMARDALGDEAVVERATATVPLRRVAAVGDVARQVAVLASGVLSGHVTGGNVMVDGGMEGRVLFPMGGR